MGKVRMIGRFLGIILLTAVVVFMLLINVAPFGVTLQYSSDNTDGNISDLGPPGRVKIENKNGVKTYHILHDLTYITTKMPYIFNTAIVTMIFKNPYPDQTISIGYKDKDTWHYNNKLIDVPILNSLNWTRTSNADGPELYQRNAKFKSINDFFSHVPQDALIGTYNYDLSNWDSSKTIIKNYRPSSSDTIINIPLRGSHTFYTYLENEPFRMSITKQDLNWYEDPDPMTVKIYKDNDLVYQATAEDDGITDASRKITSPQTISIKNPGPGLPEPGIYKVVVDANDDTIIKQIRTNLHKIVFQSPVFLAGNNTVYPGVIASTSATTLYTNAAIVSAMTYHNTYQSVSLSNHELNVNDAKVEEFSATDKDMTQVVVPKNDLILKGYLGYFATDPSEFFAPSRYRTFPITTESDLDLVNYIVADYRPAKNIGDWQTSTQTFDVSDAVITNGKLSWLIQTPNLQDDNRDIIVKSINITFKKTSIF